MTDTSQKQPKTYTLFIFRELFGDGLPIAGATLLFSFGQHSVFSTLDINNYLLILSEKDEEKKNPSNQDPFTTQYLSNAKWFVTNTEDICSILRNIKK